MILFYLCDLRALCVMLPSLVFLVSACCAPRVTVPGARLHTKVTTVTKVKKILILFYLCDLRALCVMLPSLVFLFSACCAPRVTVPGARLHTKVTTVTKVKKILILFYLCDLRALCVMLPSLVFLFSACCAPRITVPGARLHTKVTTVTKVKKILILFYLCDLRALCVMLPSLVFLVSACCAPRITVPGA